MSFYHLLKNWKVNVKNIIGVLSLLLFILVLPKTVSSVTIERVKPMNTAIELKLGEKREFKVKGKGALLVDPIDRIVFSAEGNPQVNGKEEDGFIRFKNGLIHDIQ